uniref:GOST seven transmembrane domain-containing protein n=1 Tax=Aplanochytrium stocchinoi TaxID=215587 RepID=A0A7S3PQ74_9STRA|mmetsp:Transcript_19913/g.25426  ORF Transcript_19913/g.25426 Transcript_19913/m.25426 type:complete len:241 (+) Transcript_19913:757-1479(+)
MKVTGSAFGWNVVYYLFATLKGISFFTVLLMIGSGWTLLKPTLNDWEMKILLIVLPLQLFANIALIVDDETTKGSQGWFRWRDLFLLVDFICAVAVVLPVFWQINFLKQAAKVDGKARLNLQKLKQFQQFYVQMIAYIYFTRIVVFLLGTTLPFHMTYVQAVLKEAATLIFFTLTGYRFRPAADNAYLRVTQDDEDLDDDPDGDIFFDEFDTDFGLEDDGSYHYAEQELVPPNRSKLQPM